MSIPNYLDQNKKIYIGVHYSVSKNNVFDKLKDYSPSFMDGEVVFKNNRFYRVQLSEDVDERKLMRLCRMLQKDLALPLFFTSYRNKTDHFEIGHVYYDPNKKRSHFYLIGVWDIRCDIYFPKRNVVSSNPLNPVFGSFKLELPTTVEDFNKTLENHSIDLCDSLQLSPYVRKEIVGRILTSTFIYHPSRIWKENEIPHDLVNFIPECNISLDGGFNAFEKHISKNEYQKKNAIKEKQYSKTYTLSTSSEKIKKYLREYPHITKNSLQDFFRFLSDFYYKKDDLDFQSEELVGFLSIISDFIKFGNVEVKSTKKGVSINYIIE